MGVLGVTGVTKALYFFNDGVTQTNSGRPLLQIAIKFLFLFPS